MKLNTSFDSVSRISVRPLERLGILIVVTDVLQDLSFEIATPDEARQMLGLKGGNNVAF